MVPAASSAHHHDHGQLHTHSHGHDHSHVHDAATPHPAQSAPWSILRLTVTARVSAALAVCAVLWGVVFLAMR